MRSTALTSERCAQMSLQPNAAASLQPLRRNRAAQTVPAMRKGSAGGLALPRMRTIRVTAESAQAVTRLTPTKDIRAVRIGQGRKGNIIMRRHRRAKIVATVGPASNTPEMLKALFMAGVDTFRLNFSHG